MPVSISPQVAALTNTDGLWPRCARQSPPDSLSRIRASRVAESGMRNSASARHINATPSWLESEYSWISPSTPPVRERDFSRRMRTRLVGDRGATAGASWGVAAADVEERGDAFGLRTAMGGGDGGAKARRGGGGQGGERICVTGRLRSSPKAWLPERLQSSRLANVASAAPITWGVKENALDESHRRYRLHPA